MQLPLIASFRDNAKVLAISIFFGAFFKIDHYKKNAFGYSSSKAFFNVILAVSKI